MKVRLFAKTAATTLLVATLIMTFIISPILASNDFFDGISSGQSTLGKATLDTTDPKYPKSETLTGGKVEPNSTIGNENKLYSTNEWSEFAGDDKGSTQLVIGINNGISDAYTRLMGIIAKHDCEVVNTVSMAGETTAVVVNVSSKEMQSFVEETRADGLSRYIELRKEVHVQFVPNDPYWSWQWGPQKIEADWAWNTTTGDLSVLVAVIDTGVDYDHPDLASNYVALGYDWVNNDSDPMDDEGHGTHCAGIIAAVVNNSLGVAGLSQVRIMAEKGLDQYGGGYEDDLANAIIHAVDQGADILSNSWGGYGKMELIHDAVRYAYDAGVLVIAAAGNEATSTRMYPAAYDEVIAVTATNQYDNPAYFTNFGEWVELAAPGVDIYSTYWDNTYTSMSGTSMSTPHVSGVAALIWSQFSNMTRDWVRAQLSFTADDLGDPGFDYYYGHGRINARKAVEQAPPDHDLLILSLESPLCVEPGSTAYINTTVFNFGTSNESDVTVQLLANGTMVDSAVIGFLASGTSTTVSCSWSPMVEGMYNVTAYVVPIPDENFTANNWYTKFVKVGYVVMIGIIETHGETLHTEELANYYTSLWHIVEKITKTITPGVLDNYDIVIAGEWGGTWSPSEIAAVQTYIDSGGGFVAIGDELDMYVQEILGTYGISYTWISAPGGPSSNFDPLHPIMRDVNFIYASSPVNSLQITAPAYWIANDISDTYILIAGAEVGGYVLCLSNDFAASLYNDDNEVMFKNIVDWMTVKYEHELAVSLDAPSFLEPGDSSLLNATVYNRGLNNETDVELFLIINGTVVNNVTIPELVNGTYYTIDYLWTPTVEGIYNLTAYAPPVPSENITANNFAMKFVTVCFAKYALWDDVHDGDGDSLTGNYFSLYQLLSSSGFVVHELTGGTIDSGVLAPYDILVLIDPEYDFLSSEITDIHDWVEAGGALIVIPNSGYPSTLNTIMEPYGVQLTGLSTGAGTTTNFIAHPITQNVGSIYYDRTWELAIASPSEALAWTLEYYAFLSATTGSEIVVISDSNIMDNYRLGMADNTQLMLNIFNWIGVRYEHELAVSLDAPTFLEPGDSSLLNATVYNRGLSNETDVELQLLINGTEAESVVIPELLSGSSYTLSHLWMPTIEGIYNVTAYAPPVPDENVTANNVKSVFVLVKVPPDILIVNDDDGSSLISGTSLQEFESALTVAGYDYWVWDESSMGNPPLDFLTKFELVIWTCGDHWNWAVDPTDAATLEFYLAQGGNILLEGEDIGYNHHADDFMVNVAHAIYQVDDTGAPGLTVTDSTHPVTFGLPTSFTWLTNPLYDDGVSPTNGGAEVIQYTGTAWTAVTVFEGASDGSVVYYAFPLYCLEESHGETLAINSVNWLLGVQYEHEIGVALEAPDLLEPGDSSLLNATVYNRGLNNETDVELFLLINGSIVDSVVIPELLTESSYTLSHMWTPTVEATYNVTAYAPPVPGENVTANNLVSKMVLSLESPDLYIIPATILGPPPGLGESFTVDIYLEDIVNLTGWTIGLAWNASVLNCTGWKTLFNTEVMGPSGDWIWVEGTINNTIGQVYPPYGYALKGGADPRTPKSGSDTLVQVNFTVLDYGFTWINLTWVRITSNRVVTPVGVTNGTFELPPHYQLTVTSSPLRGITFTINGVPETTPYTELLPEGSYTLIMPQTHKGYVWSHWLEDGDTNRIKTISLSGTTWTAVYKRKRPTGGKAAPINIPINKPETPTLWIWLSTIILPLVATIVFVKLKKKQ